VGDEVWKFLMDRELAKVKQYQPGLDEETEEELLRQQGLEGFLMNTCRAIDWDAPWDEIKRQLGIPRNRFKDRPPLCAKEPFRVLSDIAERTGRPAAFGMDFMHGSSGLSAWAYTDMGLKLETYRSKPDGTFKGEEPYPNLFEFVRFFVRLLKKMRIPGVARDEDGDRTIPFTDKGSMFQGDIMEAVVASYKHIKTEAKKPRAKRKKLIFLGEVKFDAKAFEDHLKRVGERYGVEVECAMTPVGFGYIKDAMERVNTAIINGKREVVLFEGRPSPVTRNGRPAPIVLNLENAEPVVLGAELSGHQMDKFWFAEDELTLIGLLSAWVEEIQEARDNAANASETDPLESDPESLWNKLNDMVASFPETSPSPELRLGSEDEFDEENKGQVSAIFETIRQKAGPEALARVREFTGTTNLSPTQIAQDAAKCKEIIVQGTREMFLKEMGDRFGLEQVRGSKKIAGNNCFVFRSKTPVKIELGGSFVTFDNVEIYMSRIDGMHIHFKSGDQWASFVVRKSNTQPEIISRVVGATPEMRDAVTVFMLSFFEQFQGTYLARDAWIREELFSKIAYSKLNNATRERVDASVPDVVARVKEAVETGRLSVGLSLENLEKFVFLKDHEKKAELERLQEIAREWEADGVVPEERDIASLVHAFVGDTLSDDIRGAVRVEYESSIRGAVAGFGSEELYRRLDSHIATYVNIRVRDELVRLASSLGRVTEDMRPEGTVGRYGATAGATAPTPAAETMSAPLRATRSDENRRDVVITETGRTHDRVTLVTEETVYLQGFEDRGMVELYLENGGPVEVVNTTGQAIATLATTSPTSVSSNYPIGVRSSAASEVRVTYTNTDEERIVASALEATREYAEEGVIQRRIQESGKEGIQIILTQDLARALYRRGGPRATGRPQNEEKAIEDFLRRFLSVDVEITIVPGWSPAALEGRVNTDKYIPVAWTTEAEVNEMLDHNMTEELTSLSRFAQLPPISDNLISTLMTELPGQGCFFVREFEALSVMIACTNEEDLVGPEAHAEKLAAALNTMTSYDVSAGDLSRFLPIKDATLPVAVEKQANVVQIILNNVPAQPFNWKSDIERRRAVLWSV